MERLVSAFSPEQWAGEEKWWYKPAHDGGIERSSENLQNYYLGLLIPLEPRSDDWHWQDWA